ncbi:MAG: putative metal-dependent hydrolase [Gemmatimonadetes bacterium]|nr:putative metal-dependent hydrolase [Gemmatimonadota bacterium]
MTSSDLEALRFPIGRFDFPESPSTGAERAEWIERIASTPRRLREAVEDLDEAQLDTRYRPDGWTARQVVHHVVDSHVNSYIRFKLTKTEDHPTIGTYMEALWGEESDARTLDVGVSLDLLDALHRRWTAWLGGLPEDAWGRLLHHPEHGDLRLDQLLAMYAWHGDHHIAHITELRTREAW